MKNKASVLSFIPVTDEHFERSKHVFWSIPKHFQPFVLVLVWNRLPRTQHPDSVYSRGCFLSINLTFVAVSVKTAAIFTLKAQSTCWLKHYATHTYFGEDLKKKKKKVSYLTRTQQTQRGQAARDPQDTSPLVVAGTETQTHTLHEQYFTRDATDAKVKLLQLWFIFFFPHSQRCSGCCDSCFSASSLSLRRQPLSCFSRGGETARLLIRMSTTTTLRSHCTSPGV